MTPSDASSTNSGTCSAPPESARERGALSQDFQAGKESGFTVGPESVHGALPHVCSGPVVVLDRIEATIATVAADDPLAARKIFLLDRVSVLIQSAVASIAFVRRCEAVVAAGGTLHPVTVERRAIEVDGARSDTARIRRLMRRYGAMKKNGRAA